MTDTARAIVECPRPNDLLQTGQRVIASGVHRDPPWGADEGPVVYGALVINDRSPNAWFSVVEIELTDDCTTVAKITNLYTEANIVPAVHCFHETFGFWGGGALTHLGNGSPHA